MTRIVNHLAIGSVIITEHYWKHVFPICVRFVARFSILLYYIKTNDNKFKKK